MHRHQSLKADVEEGYTPFHQLLEAEASLIVQDRQPYAGSDRYI